MNQLWNGQKDRMQMISHTEYKLHNRIMMPSSRNPDICNAPKIPLKMIQISATITVTLLSGIVISVFLVFM